VDCAEAYLRTKWHLDPSSRLATIYMGRKVDCAPFLGELGLHLTHVTWAEAYLPTKWCVDPSNRFATYTNVTDRHDRRDNGPIA